MQRPFLVLAPLEGVADTVFRQIVASCARPDIFVTEFTSADGWCSPGRTAVKQSLQFDVSELPIVAQLWGRNPEALRKTARDVALMGFSGIDINMGCPDRAVMKSGCGAALIDTPDIAAEVIRAIKQGIADSKKEISVSVKTRIGVRTQVTESWITHLLRQEIDALAIHARTAKELSKVPARWEEIGKAVEIRNKVGVETAIIGNGDVKDAKEAMEKHKAYGVDGVMIGRGIFSNMYAFDRQSPPHAASPREYLDIMERHVRLYDTIWGKKKNYAVLKKFYKIYVNGFRNATNWRVTCMDTNTKAEVLRVIQDLRASTDLNYTS